ncbi:MAG: M56 family metallopeptidase [Lachnospiraceae bacterium]|nr:M56 family metallopeptidase [Lachnospiraceae bacterium]
MIWIAIILLGIWFATVIVVLIRLWRRKRQWNELQRWNLPAQKEQEIASKVSHLLSIKKEISVYKNKIITVPVIFGLRKPIIVLPENGYRENELEMIFFHELCHYKNSDLKWKAFLNGILIFHVLNPMRRKIQKDFDRWGEICCDQSVRKYAKNMFTIKNYYLMMIEHQENDRRSELAKSDFCSALFEKRSDLEERMRVMRTQMKSLNRKNYQLVLAICFAGLFLFITYLAGTGIQVCAETLYNSSINEIEVDDNTNIQENYIELTEIDWEEGYEIVEMPDSLTRGTSNINWDIGSKKIAVSKYFNLSKGDKIKLKIVISPESEAVKAGYQCKGSNPVVVKGKEYISHTFSVSKTGNYRIYIKNTGSKKISVTGSFEK